VAVESSTRRWEPEELYTNLERENGLVALRIVRDFERQLS
jgi:hypothetical protein